MKKKTTQTLFLAAEKMRFCPTNGSVTEPVQCQGDWETATMLRRAVFVKRPWIPKAESFVIARLQQMEKKPWLDWIITHRNPMCQIKPPFLFADGGHPLWNQCTDDSRTDSRDNMIKLDSIPCQIPQMWRYRGPFSFGVVCFVPTEKATKDKHALDMSEHKWIVRYIPAQEQCPTRWTNGRKWAEFLGVKSNICTGRQGKSRSS